MTPDDLRSLADALSSGTHYVESPELHETMMRAAAYLRACADAKPVAHYAMLDSHRRLVEQAIQSAEHPSGMSTHDGKARIDASILRRMLAIIDSLSAVPAGWKLVPVEPTPEMLSAVGMMDGYDWHAPGCSPDADHANWYSAMIAAAPAVPQDEPKREPLHELPPLPDYLSPGTVREYARAVERAHGIGDSDE